MDKVLVDVYVPSIEKSYNIYIPLLCKISIIEELISNAIIELSNYAYQSGNNPMLCFKDNGKELDKEKTPYDLKIDNGTRLIII